MYCTNCGQHVADNAKFCWHCGERITQHNLTTTPEAIDDLVTNKAEEIMVQEDNISFSDLGTNDYVAQKASFMAEISQPSSQTQSSLSIPISSQQLKEDDSIQLPKRNEIDKKEGITLIQEIKGATIHYYYVDRTTGDTTDYFNSSSLDRNGLFIGLLNGKNGLFYFDFNQGNTFEIILPCIYEGISKIGEDRNNTIYLLKKEGKFGLFSFNNLKDNPSKIILPCIYDEIIIEDPPIGLNIIKQDGKYGLFHNYHNILPCAYDKISKIGKDRNNTIYLLKKEGKYGLFSFNRLKDSPSKIILPCTYDEIKIEDPPIGLNIIKQDGKYGLFHNYHNILPCAYEKIRKIKDVPAYGKVYEITKEGKYGYIYYSAHKNLNIISCVLSKEIDFRFRGEFVIYKGVKYRINLLTGDLYSSLCSNISKKILSYLIKIIVLWPPITYIFTVLIYLLGGHPLYESCYLRGNNQLEFFFHICGFGIFFSLPIIGNAIEQKYTYKKYSGNISYNEKEPR